MADTGVQQERQEEIGQAQPRQRGVWTTILLILGGLIALGVGATMWAASVHRHKASTYGITDPSASALRIENRTSDFAITRVTIVDAEERVAFQEAGMGVGVGAETVLEIAPGTYLVRVDYAETGVVVPWRPQGSLSESIKLSPGEAVLLCLQGGRSSPEGSIFIPPVLALK
ncbi:MAG: hypothetical protein GTO14_08580 [Anaerolineales bacterium]|nr:hypothetical protein [Anaerolineales bacterium]